MGAPSSNQLQPPALRALLGVAEGAFFDLTKRLERQCPDLLKEDGGSQTLRAALERRRRLFGGKIDYKQNTLSFNRAFFLRNLFKNLVATAWIRSRVALDATPVMDIGTGMGTSAIAWSSFGASTRLSIVDKSTEQITVAQRCCASLGINAEFSRVSFPNCMIPQGTLGLFSYLWCEHASVRGVPPRSFLHALRGRHALLV